MTQGTWRARAGAVLVVVGMLFVGLALRGPSAQAATNPLAGWSQQGAATAGAWQVAGDGLSVNQASNLAPTFFVSPTNYSAANFTVTMTPATTSDDDYIGVVLGYAKPLNDATCGTADCPVDTLLLDWKKGSQPGGADEGLNLIRVNGTFNVRSTTDQIPCFWTHVASNQCQIIATVEGANTGWVFDQPNVLKINYSANHIKVEKVTGQTSATLIDQDCTCPAGRIGFYNYSEANVTYGIADLPADPGTTTTTVAPATTTTVAPSTTTLPTTVRAVIAPTTTTRVLARTGDNATTTTLQLLAGVALMAFGALMVGARGRRPGGRFYT